MGYEREKTLFTLPYDWRQSNVITAERLDEKIDAALVAANGVSYVNQDGKVDVVVHSMGGLVTRAYVQGSDYDGDVHKVIFIATPHKGFPSDYRTREGLTWDDYLYGDPLINTVFRYFMNEDIWPALITKKYNPMTDEWLEGGCYPFSGDPALCPKSTLHEWSHDPTRGIQSLLEMLPTEGVEAYLCSDLDSNGGCLGDLWPYGHEVNQWLGDLNASITSTSGDGLVGPGKLNLDDIYVIYGNGVGTDHWYKVISPTVYAPLWHYGQPEILDVDNDKNYETSAGDDLIPTYSSRLRDKGNGLLPDLPEENEKSPEEGDPRHKW